MFCNKCFSDYAAFLKYYYSFWKKNFFPKKPAHVLLAVLYLIPLLLHFLASFVFLTPHTPDFEQLNFIINFQYYLLFAIFSLLVPFIAFRFFNIKNFRDFLPVFLLVAVFTFLINYFIYPFLTDSFFSQAPFVIKGLISAFFEYFSYALMGFGALALFKKSDKVFALKCLAFAFIVFVFGAVIAPFFSGFPLSFSEYLNNLLFHQLFFPFRIASVFTYFLLFSFILYFNEYKKQVFITATIFLLFLASQISSLISSITFYFLEFSSEQALILMELSIHSAIESIFVLILRFLAIFLIVYFLNKRN